MDTSLVRATTGVIEIPEFKNAKLTAETKTLASVAAKAAEGIDSASREVARILARIAADKLYVDDGFKSVADYAAKIGIKKSMAYMLSAAGAVYNDKKAPAQIKAMTPSNIGAIAACIKADKEKVYKDAENGVFGGKTQKDLKEYAQKFGDSAESKDGKDGEADGTTAKGGNIVPTFYAQIPGTNAYLCLTEEADPAKADHDSDAASPKIDGYTVTRTTDITKATHTTREQWRQYLSTEKTAAVWNDLFWNVTTKVTKAAHVSVIRPVKDSAPVSYMYSFVTYNVAAVTSAEKRNAELAAEEAAREAQRKADILRGMVMAKLQMGVDLTPEERVMAEQIKAEMAAEA